MIKLLLFILAHALLFFFAFMFFKSVQKIFKLLPNHKNLKRLVNISKIGKKEKDLADYIIESIDFIVQKVSLNYTPNSIKEENLKNELERVGSKDTPAKFMVKVYLYPIIALICSFAFSLLFRDVKMIMFFVQSLGVFVALLMFFAPRKELNAKIRRKREQIIMEAPRFVRTIRYSPSDKPLHDIVRDFLISAKEGLRYDLKLLLADLEMTSEEEALRNFANRINVPEIYEFVTVLQNSLNTVDRKQRDMNLFFVETNLQRQIDRIIDVEINKRPEILNAINDLLLYALGILLIVPMAIYTFEGISVIMK